MGPQSGDSRFNMEACNVKKKKCQNGFEWLVEAFVKRRPTEKELEMCDIPWFSIDGRILRVKKILML